MNTGLQAERARCEQPKAVPLRHALRLRPRLREEAQEAAVPAAAGDEHGQARGLGLLLRLQPVARARSGPLMQNNLLVQLCGPARLCMYRTFIQGCSWSPSQCTTSFCRNQALSAIFVAEDDMQH